MPKKVPINTVSRHRMLRLMMALMLTTVFFAPSSFAQAPFEQSSKAVDLASLLSEATDLSHLARFPRPAYVTHQASSYDRRSTDPKQSTVENWFANGDASNYLRTEHNDGRKEWVMMEHEGPGAVVRIWSANPKGTLRVYLDGKSDPAIEADMAELLGGAVEGIPEPIAGVRGRGYNLFLPIPFSKSCKITSDSDRFYYIVNYRSYPDGTAVTTFSRDGLEEAAEQVKQTATEMQAGLAFETPGPDAQGRLQSIELSPGKGQTLDEASGKSGKIERLALKLEAEDREQALRQTLLRLSFDGKTTVEVPVGDFFGSAPGVNPYTSLPFVVKEDGWMLSRWPMPFRNAYAIELVTTGSQPVKVEALAEVTDREWTDNSMHFHATFHATYDLPTIPRSDMTLLQAQGKGMYVGTSMAIANPVRAWWGEGDEKVYVDGESFPSWFGTGTEDYFGYAWCDTALFEHAYHSQSRCDGPDNYGHTSVNRFHVIDAIPFKEEIRFDMEMWHWVNTKVDVATVAYWYGGPDALQTGEQQDLRQLEVREMPEYVVEKVEGAIEGEEMAVTAKPEHANATPQAHGACKSNEQQMWWHHKPRPGDELVLSFRLPEELEAGNYRLLGRFLKAPDYAIVAITVNGTDAKQELDLYHSSVVATDELNLGVHQLYPDGNEIRVTIRGKNAKAAPQYMFGLDYVRPILVE